MTRLNLATGAIGILLGIAALVHALFNFTSNLVFVLAMNLSLLLCGIFLVSGLFVLKKVAQEQNKHLNSYLCLVTLFLVMIVATVNIMLRENFYRAELLARPLEKALSLKGRSYEFKRDEFAREGFPEGRHFGVIAQELEKELPGLVVTRPDGKKAVEYYEIVPILIEAVKEQQKIIDSQKKEIGEIKDILVRMQKK